MASMAQDPDASEISARVAVEAASYDNTIYVGAYQAVTPSLGWAHGRFGASAAIGLYHVNENGRSVYGVGDAMLGAHVLVVAREHLLAGAALHAMLPTGSEPDSLGMGHVMLMPAAWASWRTAPWTVSATAGYSRGLTEMSGTVHVHGAGPLVDPMNLQELTWSASADLDLGHGLVVGGRTTGAAPIGMGRTRAIGGGRVAWGTPRITTGLELQLGLVGDPFTVRGVVDTALRF
jgi:hypothetical protein